jgi:hypothetical protein
MTRESQIAQPKPFDSRRVGTVQYRPTPSIWPKLLYQIDRRISTEGSKTRSRAQRVGGALGGGALVEAGAEAGALVEAGVTWPRRFALRSCRTSRRSCRRSCRASRRSFRRSMPAVGAGAGATYAASGGGAGATIGGGEATTGAGGWLWLHAAATSANAGAIMIGLANLTITLSLGDTASIRA